MRKRAAVRDEDAVVGRTGILRFARIAAYPRALSPSIGAMT